MTRSNQPRTPLDELGRFGRLDDALGRSCANAISFGYADAFDVSVIQSRGARLRYEIDAGLVAPFSLPSLGHEGLVVGRDARGTWVRQPYASFDGHTLVLASSGGAKTSWMLMILSQLLTSGVGLLAFDTYKQSLRGLLAIGRRLGREVVVIRAHDDRWNLLDPGGLDARTHLQLVVSLLSRTLGLPGVSRALLQNAIFDLFESYGLFQSQKKNAPTLFDVFEHVRTSMPDANYAARQALLERLGSLLVSITPAVGAWRRGWRAEDLQNHLVVFELASASEWHRALRLTSIMFQLMHLRNRSGGGSPLMIVADDALPMLQGAGVEGGGLTPLAEALTLVRSSGLTFFVLAQTLAGIDPSLVASLNNKIVGRLASAHDWAAVGRELFLDQRQLAWARANLRPGTLLVQLAEGHREPFPVEVPKLPAPASPNDEEVVASQRVLSAIPTAFAESFRQWSPRPKSQAHRSAPSESGQSASHPTVEAAGRAPASIGHPSPADAAKSSEMSEAERVLAVVSEHPLAKSSELPKLAGMSPKRFRALRRRLVGEGLLAEVKVQTSPTGRPAIVLELTPDGLSRLQEARP